MKSSKTVIMIAHRESTVRRADKVFWLRDGNLCGVGTHSKLIVENKDYASFWERDSHQP
ncbi:hypothetical protein IFR05_017419 [Cadophora sp. M221]|nr:hypothetical protein IFR05_017419 [Cadophora sp. M221]